MSTRPARSPRFAPQFDPSQIPVLADRYSYPGEERIVGEIGPAARERGYCTRSEFIEVCGWKTGRSKSRVAANSEEEVTETTRLALGARSEALRIWIPMALAGVQWATSSVLLHFGHRDRYPILDYGALSALGVTDHANTVSFWNAYVAACRAIGMRTIDRALWQWSKEQDKNR